MTFEFRGLSPKPVSGNAANRDSINVKIFEEKGVGFGEGEEKLSEESFSSLSPMFLHLLLKTRWSCFPPT